MNKLLATIILLIPSNCIAQDFYIVKWTASWCGPCQQWNRNERNNVKAKVVDIDIDKRPDLVQKYKITSVPQFYVCGSKDLNVHKKFTGYTSAETIMDSIKKLKEKDD